MSRRILQIVAAPPGLFAQYAGPWLPLPDGKTYYREKNAESVHVFALVEDENGTHHIEAASCGALETDVLWHDDATGLTYEPDYGRDFEVDDGPLDVGPPKAA